MCVVIFFDVRYVLLIGVPLTDASVIDISRQILYPARASTPSAEAAEEEDISVNDDAAQTEATPDVTVPGAPVGLTSSNSFHFMQASEIETPAFDQSEWVAVEPAEQTPVPTEEARSETQVNGHAHAVEVRPYSRQQSFYSSRR